MKSVAMKSIAGLIVIIAVAGTVSGCATTGSAMQKTGTAADISQATATPSSPVAVKPDWDALFTAFAGKETEVPSPQKKQAASFFSANKIATAEAVTRAISTPGYTREIFSGACDAAGYIKAAECLPAIEARLRAESDWFLRYACANAIDSIDAASSQISVISALDTETNGLVAMLCAMYLTRHPVANSRELLDRKHLEFSSKADESSIIACIFLEDAILALNTGN